MVKHGILFMIWFVASTLYAQTNFTGKVVSKSGKGLSYCSIALKNNPAVGTISDYEGNFKIKASKGDTLVFVFVGYETIFFPLVKEVKLRVVLKQKMYKLKPVEVNPKDISASGIALLATEKRWRDNHSDYRDSSLALFNLTAHISHKIDDNQVIDTLTFNIYKSARSKLRISERLRADIKPFNITTYTKDLTDLKYFRLVNRKYSPFTSINSLHSYILPHNKTHFKHSFGQITYYKDKPVYHVKYHRKKGLGYCEGGGMLLIDRQDFSVLYIEHVSRKCLTDYDNEKELKRKYKVKTEFFKTIIKYKNYPGIDKKYPYAIEKVEKYKFTRNREQLLEGSYRINIEVNMLTVGEENVLPKLGKKQLEYKPFWYLLELSRYH